MKKALAFAALAFSTSVACDAAAPTPVPENLLACSKLQDAAERVRCYDTQIAAMSSATASKSAPAAAGNTPAATASAASPAPAAAVATPGSPAGAAAAGPAAPSVPTATALAATPTTRPVTAAPPAVPGRQPEAASSTPPVASDRSPAAEFGQEELPQAQQPRKGPQSLSSRITALTAVGAKKYLISLENGQVWRQQESAQVASFFHVGDDVRITKGALGSYQLSTVAAGEKNWIPVMRMR